MENASKALLIAGGILFALLIITVLLYMNQNIITVRQTEQEKIEIEQLQKFNQEYEVYNKKLMYGAEVMSLINKMKNNNEKYKGNSNYQMSYTLSGFTENNIEKTGVYTCTDIQYSTETGRVKSMTFTKYEQ